MVKHIDLSKAKGEAPINKFIGHFNKQQPCDHGKEIHLELSLRSVENW